jgi:D-galacturonate reductase
MVGTTGTKYPGIRKHFEENIKNAYKDINVEFESFPADNVEREPKAYIAALDTMEKGDLVTIFTPDDTHFDIAKEAIVRGLHVLVTKPPVKTLKEHQELVELARKHGVLVMVEYHKRFDPSYAGKN